MCWLRKEIPSNEVTNTVLLVSKIRTDIYMPRCVRSGRRSLRIAVEIVIVDLV